VRNKGSILIIVLWALFILGALAVAISGYVRAGISIADKLSEMTRNYYIAKAGAERAILEVKNNDTTEKYDALTDTWSANDAVFRKSPLGNGNYSIVKRPDASDDGPAARYGLSDEEGKINVNKAGVNVLKDFLEIAGGVSPEDSLAIAASIVNWRSPEETALKEGAGAFHYQALSRPYKARNAEIEVPEELLLVQGMTSGIFNKIKNHLTIYGNGAVNINTADKIVLRSIGMSGELADKVINFRESPADSDNSTEEVPNFFDDTAKIVSYLTKKESISAEESGKINNLIAQSLLGVSSDNFSGTAIGRIGDKAGGSRISFVFDRGNNIVRWWRE